MLLVRDDGYILKPKPKVHLKDRRHNTLTTSHEGRIKCLNVVQFPKIWSYNVLTAQTAPSGLFPAVDSSTFGAYRLLIRTYSYTLQPL